MQTVFPKSEIRRITEACHIVEQETFVNPSRVYCAVTGKPFARLDDETLTDIFTEIPSSMDAEELCDDLLLRTLSSMRPSPAWNSLDYDSLRGYVQTRPAEVLAYCLNRLFEPNNGLKQSSDSRLFRYQQRITRWVHIRDFVACGFDVSEFLYWLIEIDAKYNLTTLPVPADELITFGLVTDHVGLKLFRDRWIAWYSPLHAEYEKRQKAAIQQANWLKGNSLAKRAHFDLWLDRKPTIPVGSGAEAKKQARREKRNRDLKFFDLTNAAFADISFDSEPAPEPKKPNLKPPVRFGFKKAEA